MSFPAEFSDEKGNTLGWNSIWDSRTNEEWKIAAPIGKMSQVHVCLIRSIAQGRTPFFKKFFHLASSEMFANTPDVVSLAVMHGRPEILEFLLEQYPKDVEKHLWSSLLIWPVRQGDISIMMILAEVIKNINWEIYLMRAVDFRQLGVIEIIMGWNSKNAKISLRDAIVECTDLMAPRYTPLTQIKTFLREKKDEMLRLFKSDEERKWFLTFA